MSKTERAAEKLIKGLKRKAVEKNFGTVIDIDQIIDLQDRDIKSTLRKDIETYRKLSRWFINEFDYLVAYHGTTNRVREAIEEEGLRTRSETEVPSIDSKAESHPDKIYFGVAEKGGFPRRRANEIAKGIGGRVLLVKAILDTSRLFPDEDAVHFKAKPGDAFYSIYELRTVAHIGSVAPPGAKGPSRVLGTREFGQSYGDTSQLTEEQLARKLEKSDIS